MTPLLIKALIVVTSHGNLGNTGKPTGWYLSEVSHAYFPMADAGIQIDFASPQGGNSPMDASSLDLNDPINKRFVENSKVFNELKNTIPLSAIQAKDYQIIYFAGGHGTMWDFPESEDLKRITSEIYEQGGIVSAVCHGPAALVNLKLSNGKFLVENKNIAAFSNEEEKAVGLESIVPFALETKLIEQGAKHSKAGLWQKHVVIDGRLVTGQNPQSAEGVGEGIVSVAKSLKTIK